MDKNYRKNICTKQIQSIPSLKTYLSCLENVSSTGVINAIIDSIIQNETDISNFYAFLLGKINSSLIFYDKCINSNFHLLLKNVPIKEEEYIFAFEFYKEVPIRKIHEFPSFINLFIYQSIYSDYKITNTFPNFASQLEKQIFYKYFFDLINFYQTNEPDEETLLFLKNVILASDYKDKNNLLYLLRSFLNENIVSNEFDRLSLTQVETSNSLISLFNPLFITDAKNDDYLHLYLCFKNSQNDICTICNRNIKFLKNYFTIKESYFNNLIEDTLKNEINFNNKNLNLLFMHEPKFLSSKNFKNIFYHAIYKNEDSYFNLLSYFPIDEESEKIILEGLKKGYNNFNSFKAIFKLIKNINANEKILFAIFIVLYKNFTNLNLFAKLKIKNYFYMNKQIFIKVRKQIIEYIYVNNNTTLNTNETILADLSEILNYEVNDFIKKNILFIFPVSLHYIKYSSDEISKNVFYLLINELYDNKEDLEGLNLLGYDISDVIQNNKFQIIAYILLINHNNLKLLNDYLTMDYKEYIIQNLTPVLFNVRMIFNDNSVYCNILETYKLIISFLNEKKELKKIINIKETINLLEYYLECFVFNSFSEINSDFFVDLYEKSSDIKSVLVPYLPIYKLKGINNIIKILLDSKISSASGTKYLFNKIIKLAEEINISSKEKERLIYEICNRKIYSEEIISFISNVTNEFKCFSYNKIQKKYSFDKDILSLSDISFFLVEVLLDNINYEKQYIYYFTIQETIKSVEQIENAFFYDSVKSFFNTKYYLEVNLERNTFIYDRNIKYSCFINNLLISLLNDLLILENELYELTKYSLLLDDQVKEIYLFIIIKYSIKKEINEIFYKIEELFNDIIYELEEYVDKKIIYFFMNLFIFTDESIFDIHKILEMAVSVNDNYFIIYLTEKIIKNKENDALTDYNDILLHSNYLINNFDYIIGLSNLTNHYDLKFLFYKFCIERNFVLAKKCISKKENNLKLKEILNLNEKTDIEETVIKRIIEDCSSDYIKNLKRTIFYSDDLNINLKLEKLKFFYDIKFVLENKNITKISQINYKIYEKFIEELENSKDKKVNNLFLHEIKLKIKKIKIKELMNNNEIESALEEITNLLVDEEWEVLYEQSILLLMLNKKVDAKLSLMKLLSLFEENKLKNEELRIEANILYCKIMDNHLEYENALKIIKESEKLYFLQGKYYENKDERKAIIAFIMSVKYGKEYLRESIPLIFHLFCINNNTALSEIMIDFVTKTDITLFIPYFTQIIPKIASNAYKVIMKLLIRFYNEVPDKTFWDSFIFINSSSPEIKKRMEEVISLIKFDSRLLLSYYTNVTAIFTKIAQSKSTKQIIKYSDIIKSEVKYESVILPNLKMDCYIENIDEEIVVYRSLQAPKRIEIVGSDGKMHFFLCKANDDLRMDGRFIDLCELLNNTFDQNINLCHKNNLSNNIKVKVYKVIAFNHKTGVIEWIDDLTSLKDIIYKYGEKQKIHDVLEKCRRKKKLGIKDYKSVNIKPVLHKWLEERSSPKEWFYARERFIQSYAVMNVIGWFMGLGDRHCENILFDKYNFTVHVDLNCLFDKAKSFEIPEKVPFRLTCNILDGFGILGIEGCYRNTMEFTLSSLIEKKNLIIANLLSFLYDPVFEWKKTNPSFIIDSLKDKLVIDDIQNKIDELIKEAMDENNLSEMYIGWMPFI